MVSGAGLEMIPEAIYIGFQRYDLSLGSGVAKVCLSG